MPGRQSVQFCSDDDKLRLLEWNKYRESRKGVHMANNNGNSGLLGVLVGGLIVLVVGGAVLYATGVIGNKNSVTITLPKVN